MSEQNLSDLLKEQQASWDRLREKHQAEHAKFMLDFENKMEKFDRDLEAARKIARETMSKIVVLATTIIGFSVTILSVEQLNIQISESGLRTAWLLLTVTIALGLLIPYLEGRSKYVIYWRGLQHQEWDRQLKLWEKIKVSFVVAYSLLFGPRNLIYCKIYEDEAIKKNNARKNALAIHYSNKVINLMLFAELLFILVFVASLAVMLYSVTF